MKKSTGIIGLLVAAGLLWGGATWYVGNQAKTEIDTSLAKYNDLLANSYANSGFTEVSYKKGFLSSDAVYKLNLNIPELQSEPLELLFNIKVHHGPLPLLQNGQFTPALAIVNTTLVNDAATKAFFDLANGQEPVSSSTQISFSGQIESTLKTAALNYANSQRGIQASIEPALAVFHTDRDWSFINTSANLGPVKLKEGGKFAIDMEGLSINSETKLTVHDNYIGTAVVKSGKISSKLDENQAITIDSISMEGTTSETDTGLLNADIVYRLNTLKANDINFGNADMKLIISHLDMNALNAFNKELSKMDPAALADDDEISRQLEILLGKLLEHNPSFEIAPIRIKTASGQASLNFSAFFNTNDIAPENKENLEAYTLEALKKVIFSMSIDDSFIKETGAAIVKFENTQGEEISEEEFLLMANLAGPIAAQSGMALYKDGKITSDIIFDASEPDESQIEFNGKKMGLNEFAMRASSLLGFAGSSAAPALLDEEELFQALENEVEEKPEE